MKKINFFINYKYNLIVLLVLIFFSVLSLYIYQFIYDGHHHGLMFSNAIDLLNAKKPYEEIFIQYGFLTTIIHSIGLFFLPHLHNPKCCDVQKKRRKKNRTQNRAQNRDQQYATMFNDF